MNIGEIRIGADVNPKYRIGVIRVSHKEAHGKRDTRNDKR